MDAIKIVWIDRERLPKIENQIFKTPLPPFPPTDAHLIVTQQSGPEKVKNQEAKVQ